MEFIKKHFLILAAFSLPLLLIIGVALSAYLPSLFLSTNYNFVYTICSDTSGYNYYYECDEVLQSKYEVVNGTLVAGTIDPTTDADNDGVLDVDEDYEIRIFLHDTKNNESREITLEEASALQLSSLLTAPDGVSVSSGYDRGGDYFFLFGGSSSYGYYLTKGSSRRYLNLIHSQDSYYYSRNFNFLGWVLPGRNTES